jgi:hypothetical protein
LYRLNDDSKTVLIATNAALSALSKNVSAEELVNHIEFIRNLIASMVSDARRRKGGVGDGEFLLPGFNMPKGKNGAYELSSNRSPFAIFLSLIFVIQVSNHSCQYTSAVSCMEMRQSVKWLLLASVNS